MMLSVNYETLFYCFLCSQVLCQLESLTFKIETTSHHSFL